MFFTRHVDNNNPVNLRLNNTSPRRAHNFTKVQNSRTVLQRHCLLLNRRVRHVNIPSLQRQHVNYHQWRTTAPHDLPRTQTGRRRKGLVRRFRRLVNQQDTRRRHFESSHRHHQRVFTTHHRQGRTHTATRYALHTRRGNTTGATVSTSRRRVTRLTFIQN